MTRAIYVGAWRVDLTVRDGVTAPIAGSTLARTIASALSEVPAPAPASIGLILSGDAELAELNAAHLGKAGATDVLSFPLLPPEAYPPHDGQDAPSRPATGVGSGAARRSRAFVLPPGRRPHLGDIVISVERATQQATEGRGGQTGDLRSTPTEELRLLATHGTLHICGWDHAAPAEEAAMRSLETRLLAKG